MWTTNYSSDVPTAGSGLEACSTVLKERERSSRWWKGLQDILDFVKGNEPKGHTLLTMYFWVCRATLNLGSLNVSSLFMSLCYYTLFLFLRFSHSLLGLENSFSLLRTQLWLSRQEQHLLIPVLIYPCVVVSLRPTWLPKFTHYSLNSKSEGTMLFIIITFPPFYLCLKHPPPHYISGQLVFILKNPNWLTLSQWRVCYLLPTELLTSALTEYLYDDAQVLWCNSLDVIPTSKGRDWVKSSLA